MRYKPGPLVQLCMLAVVSVIAVGCASTDDHSQIRNDLNTLRSAQYAQKDELQEVKKRLAVVEAQKQQQQQKPAKSDVSDAIRESQENLNSRFEHLNKEMQQLQGRYEERKYYVDKMFGEGKTDRDVLKAQIENIENEIKELQLKMGRIDATLQQKGMAVLPPRNEANRELPQPTPPPPTPQAQPENGNVKTLYDAAIKDFQDGKFKEARDKFNRLIKDNPANPLAGNSHFWIAETYYREGSYEDAILSYDVVVKKYPGNSKIPAAKLKQAQAFIEIKDPRTAKVILQQLIEEFPKSTEAETAKKILQGITTTPAPRKVEPVKKPQESKKTEPPKTRPVRPVASSTHQSDE
ncbi:MAG: tol-pal system protein YbgF [Candidatus Magnetobacterium sp. LHC-1]|uniref:Tol-pal system protein YbgF n=1 Tax=Candidatus Magnetobacterium casense TaxID=1455061 RepID=A0ABS6RZK5_9BACT|nr:tol-pal system protein YbgF [Candidatus Magnetobacterium casensis]MBF0607278.1 tol-pal system protein YbgF [Nitrospirota bacterium]MBV6341283.1 tol-pal system protein YbgF [Candidatus Magnetobacterium casensis]